MVQYANYAGLLTSLPTVEEVLADHASELGHDLIAYRNHVYRYGHGRRVDERLLPPLAECPRPPPDRRGGRSEKPTVCVSFDHPR